MKGAVKGQRSSVLALQYRKSVPRYLWVRLMGRVFPRIITGPGAFLRLAQVPEPALPTPRWLRLRPLLSGICGSDVAAITGKSSIYLSALTSFPFVPGHEVVARVEEVGSEVTRARVGDRMVVEPALGCCVRGLEEPCSPCQQGYYANCERLFQGDIAPGIQTGYCRDTGGGWSSGLVAHESQVHPVPEEVSDQAAVLVEPLSCALHAVLQAQIPDGAQVLVIGAGSIGLLTVAALRGLGVSCTIVAVARYPHQAEAALSLGADRVIMGGSESYEALSEVTQAEVHPLPLGKPAVIGGFPVTFDCAGSAGSLEDALRWTRSRGQVILVGMPGPMQADLAPLWYQEVRLTGTYAYGLEDRKGRQVKTFDLALGMLARDGWSQRLGGLVRHRFPLRRFHQAIATALRPGRSGAVKTVFDLTEATGP